MSEITLPEGWVETPLGEYLYLKNGHAFKSNSYVAKSDDTVPVIRISDIDGKIAHDEAAIHVKKADVVDGFEIKNGDLLIAMSGATTGKVGVYKGSEPAYQNQRVGNLKLHSNEHGSSKYKNHLIASLTPDILKIAYGGAQPNISGKAIEDLLVALPPLAEQQQIAQKLDELLAQVDTLKIRLDAIPKILKRFRQSVLAAAVGGRLTDKVSSVKSYELGAVAKFIDYRGKTPTKVSEGIPLITAKNIRQGYISREPREYIAESDYLPWMTRGIPKVGDVLITTEAPLGNVASIDIAEKFALAQRAICLQFNEKVVSRFACIYMQSLPFQEALFARATGTTVKGIKASELKKIALSLPPVEEQTEVVRRVEQLFAFADQIEQRVKDAQARVNHLTQSILAKAFRGELTADWRAQNPELISGENSAAALLERIKAEREVVGKSKRKVKA